MQHIIFNFTDRTTLETITKDKEDFVQKTAILGKACKKYDAILNDARELSEEIESNLVEDVKDLSDADIGKLVHKIGKWKDSKKKLIELGRDLDELTIHYKLPEDRMENYKGVLEDVCNNVKAAVSSIEAEETLRKLYTLDPGKSEVCKLPSFSGTPKEDFIKFQKKVKNCFQKNRSFERSSEIISS